MNIEHAIYGEKRQKGSGWEERQPKDRSCLPAAPDAEERTAEPAWKRLSLFKISWVMFVGQRNASCDQWVVEFDRFKIREEKGKGSRKLEVIYDGSFR